MVTFCALHDVETEEKEEEVVAVEQGTASRAIDLDEPRAQVYLGRVGSEVEQRWYLYSGASNHMTGSKAAFSELDGGVMGLVWFGDGSMVEIRGHGTVMFQCQNGDHCGLMDVYYIP